MAIKIKHNGAWITVPTGENVIKIAYADLKDLVDNGQLKQGVEYQITDFVTTVNADFASVGAPFNVLVYAQTSKKLGMYAKAIAASEDSTYRFKDCDLSKWLLKYDINGNYDWVGADVYKDASDNEYVESGTELFRVALTGQITPTIVYGCSCAAIPAVNGCYGFATSLKAYKNIRAYSDDYDNVSVATHVSTTEFVAADGNTYKLDTSYPYNDDSYTWGVYASGATTPTKYVYSNSNTIESTETQFNCGQTMVIKYDEEIAVTKTAGVPTGFTGTIYYMKDEFGNEAPYDFKNIKFNYSEYALVGATTTEVMRYNPAKDVTYTDPSTSLPVTLNAIKLRDNKDYLLKNTGTNKYKCSVEFIFANEATVTVYDTTDTPYIQLGSSTKYQRFSGKDFIQASESWYAWIDDDCNYVYTDTATPTVNTTKAKSSLSSVTLTEIEELVLRTNTTYKGFTFGDESVDNSINTLAGVSGNLIKALPTKNFPYVYFGSVPVNCKAVNSTHDIHVKATNAQNIKFKGNEYVYVLVDDEMAGDKTENITFLANYGGVATEGEVYLATLNLASEVVVGKNSVGEIVTKNPLQSTRSFYQRNEPLNANEGDIWFSVED